MIIEVTMPVLGLTMERGTIVAWLKEVGEEVAADEPLFLVETDKATSDAPSPGRGALARIVAEEGATVEVGAVVAYLAETAEDLEHLPRAADAPRPVASPVAATEIAGTLGTLSPAPGAPAAEPGAARVVASPRARARASRSKSVATSCSSTPGRPSCACSTPRA